MPRRPPRPTAGAPADHEDAARQRGEPDGHRGRHERHDRRRSRPATGSPAARTTPGRSGASPPAPPATRRDSRPASPASARRRGGRATRRAASPTRSARPWRATTAGSPRRRSATGRSAAGAWPPSRAPPSRGRPGPTPARAARPPAMSAARTTEADAPANATYATIATIVTTDRRRRPSRPVIAADRGRDDGDVPARDRDDVAHPGRRERRREVAVHAVAQADEDPGREPRLGLGEDAGQRLARASPESLEATTRVVRCRLDGQRSRGERPDRADPRQVVAVWRVGPRPDRAIDGHDVARERPRGSGGASRRHGTGARHRAWS